MNKLVTVLLIDAFKDSYLSRENTPFLFDMAAHGAMRTISPMFAYRGIEATLFTGKLPEEHGVWSEFRLKPGATRRASSELWMKALFLSELMPSDWGKSAVRIITHLIFPNSFYPYLIPLRSVKYFEKSQKKPITTEGTLGKIKTLFDYLRENQMKFCYITPGIRKGDDAVAEEAISQIKGGNLDFCYLKFGELDNQGHRYGPDSVEIKAYVRETDRQAGRVFKALEQSKRDFSYAIVSDHGMCQVSRWVDIRAILSSIRPRLHRDYIAFFDSTMARFWFCNPDAKKGVEQAIVNSGEGIILSLEERQKMKLPTSDSYGELVFVLNEGTVLHPDFFHRSERMRGMHGYAHPVQEGYPIFLSQGLELTLPKIIDFTEIMPLLIQQVIKKQSA